MKEHEAKERVPASEGRGLLPALPPGDKAPVGSGCLQARFAGPEAADRWEETRDPLGSFQATIKQIGAYKDSKFGAPAIVYSTPYDGWRLYMNLTQRSKYSLCQFLTLFEYDKLVLLIEKYGLSIIRRWHRDQIDGVAVKNAVFQASDPQLENLIQELARTQDSMRSEVSPRYRFDERWEDFCLCLEIDGYIRERKEEGGWPGEGPLGKFVPA